MITNSDVVVIGAGFAGIWAAAAAAAVAADADCDFRIAVVSPGDDLVNRPLLYQSEPARALAPLDPILGPVGARRLAATVVAIDTAARRITCTSAEAETVFLRYQRLVLASGSRSITPQITGAVHLFTVDTFRAAQRLDAHLHELLTGPPVPGRDTVVVVGSGFTGIEVAAEMATRIRDLGHCNRDTRIVLTEAQDVIGPALGAGPRAVITDALEELGVEVMLGRTLTGVTESAAVFADGTSIECATVIWTAGMVASELTHEVPAARDRLGRIIVDEYLRVAQAPSIFVAGDSAAAVGPDGRTVLQSCQHAIPLGKFAGHNAAADLLGQQLQRFDPGPYVTCLDLGAAGAVVTTGWDRDVRLTGSAAKALKKAIVES